ncbi:glutathione S-transferase family protein [Phenylobacterium sp.]|uniref:glutathione S-transferase family protein n=1 Tax=Phenylobacterium sp. TaxID=1871053 RepID=UPI003D27E8C7
MIVYGSTLSPFVRKTLAFAAEKGIAVELQQAGMGAGPPEFKDASPFGKMPGFRDGDFLISDSSAIVTYLEAIQPEPNLIPAEPRARARAIWYDEFADTILVAAAGALFFNLVVAPRFLNQETNAAAVETGKAQLPAIFSYLEKTIPESGFLLEDRITLADLAVASPFQNLVLCGHGIDAQSYPRTAKYVDAILARPSFAPIVTQERAMFGIG